MYSLDIHHELISLLVIAYLLLHMIDKTVSRTTQHLTSLDQWLAGIVVTLVIIQEFTILHSAITFNESNKI